jgi:hypothetical protein
MYVNDDFIFFEKKKISKISKMKSREGKLCLYEMI